MRERLSEAQHSINHNMRPGYVMLLSVLVAGIVATTVTTSLLLSGLATSQTMFAMQQANQASGLATTCAEEGLMKIRNASGYTGTTNMTLAAGTCFYVISNTGGATRKINVQATVGTVTKRVMITTSALTPILTVSSWQEVADFF